ncbi:MAG TPA: hypothetical protein ENL27_01190 [Candidatus Parcubacteria bacterium]|nr:hypothetical protein [Candidatus Parcubacteria bacterium]
MNICFTTIQKLHTDLHNEKENSLTLEDFKDKKIVLISDEAHHGQVQTKNGQRGLPAFGWEKPNWENTVEKNIQTLRFGGQAKYRQFAFRIYGYDGSISKRNK